MQVLVGGVAVRLEADSPEGLLDLRAALASAPCTDEPPRFVLRSATGTVPLPERRPDRNVQHVSFWDGNSGEDGEGLVIATGPRHTARIAAGRAVLDPGGPGVLPIHSLLLPVLALLFAQTGARLVHGAGFLDPRGDAVLALGGSGRGKSTLVAAALDKGVPVLGDDLLVLRLHDGGVTVSGVPQPVALPADQAQLPVMGPVIDGDPRARRRAGAGIPLATGTYRVASVLVVEHSDHPEGHLRPAEGRDVLRALLASSLEGLAPGLARDVFPYAAAVGRLPAWHLGHAADAGRRIAAAQRRMDEIGSRLVAR